MVIIEEWADHDALDQHFATARFRRVAAVLDDILAEPFHLTRLVRHPSADGP